MREHVYWVVGCRTVGCPCIVIKLRYAGLNRAVPYIPACPDDAPAKMVLFCGCCRKTYSYCRDEIYVLPSDEPPGLDFIDRLTGSDRDENKAEM